MKNMPSLADIAMQKAKLVERNAEQPEETTKKTEIKRTRAAKPERTERAEAPSEERDFLRIFEPVFNLGDKRVVKPKRAKRHSNPETKTVPVYLTVKEYEYLKQLEKKYDMKAAAILRTLLINAE